MNLRRRRLRLRGFAGDAEEGSDLALPMQFSTRGSKNMRVDKEGEIVRVNGYSISTSAALTSTGGQTLTCIGLYDYDYEGTRRIFGVFSDGTNEVECWHSTDGGANWNRLSTSPGAGAVGQYPSFAQWDDELYIAFGGSISVLIYNGTAVSTAGQTQPTQPTVAGDGVANGPLNGEYKYKSAKIDGNGDVGPACAAVTVNVQDEGIDVSSIDLGAGGAQIYRTAANSGLFWTHSQVTSSSFNDTKGDQDLVNEGVEIRQIGDPPPAGSRHAENHLGRIYYVGSNADPNGIFPSAFDFPDQVFGDATEEIGQALAGDILSAAVSYGPDLYLSKLKSLWRLAGTDRNTWDLDRTEAATGVAAEHSIFSVPSGAVYRTAGGAFSSLGRGMFGYLTPERDIRVFDGVSDTIISWAKKETLEGFNLNVRTTAWAVHYPPYNWILFGVPTGAATVPDTYIAWDYAHALWHEVDYFPAGITAVELVETASGDYELIMGTDDGNVLECFTGWSADGSDVDAHLELRPLDLERPDTLKWLRGVDPTFLPPGSSTNATMKVWEGYVDPDAVSPFWTGTVDMYQANRLSTNPEFMLPKNDDGDFPMDEGFIWRIEVSNQDQWGLKTLGLEFQEAPATVRRPGDGY